MSARKANTTRVSADIATQLIAATLAMESRKRLVAYKEIRADRRISAAGKRLYFGWLGEPYPRDRRRRLKAVR